MTAGPHTQDERKPAGGITDASNVGFSFPPFRLDADGQLRMGARTVVLQPKALAVLRYLLERPQRLVTKQQLLQDLWSDVHVCDGVLKTHLREIRLALGDDVKAPKFIETAHRRGYRFIAPVARMVSERDRSAAPELHAPPSTEALVGRRDQLECLRRALARAQTGQRRAVFVRGEAGMGKTALVKEFQRSLRDRDEVWISWGQCIEHYGASEPYLPLLEALGGLANRQSSVLGVLRRRAPTWLAQLPSLRAPSDDAQTLELETLGATAGRLLRELAEALEDISSQHPLVLVLEDLHWADDSTLDLISYVAHRSDSARLLLLGTLRPSEVIDRNLTLAALQRSLKRRELSDEVELEQLPLQAVARYLDARFAPHRFPSELSELLRARTSGHPLFLERMLAAWSRQGQLRLGEDSWELAVPLEELARDVPETILAMIEGELDRLSTLERRLIEAASVAGAEFPVAALAAIVGEAVPVVEEACARLARRRQFLEQRADIRAADQSVFAGYGFVHTLYQQVAYEGMAVTRRARLHRSMAEWLETSRPAGIPSTAAEIAAHFDAGHDPPRAVRHSSRAARQALERSAFPEAIKQARRALQLIEQLPSGRERSELEVDLNLTLGEALTMTVGHDAPELNEVYRRARVHALQLGPSALTFAVMHCTWRFHFARGEHREAREVAELFAWTLRERDSPELRIEWNVMLGCTSFHLGELARAKAVLEYAIELSDAVARSGRPVVEDPAIMSRSQLSWVLWMLGYPDRALALARSAVSLAETLDHPPTLAFALHYLTLLFQLRRQHARALEPARTLVELATAHGLTAYLAFGLMDQGSSVADTGDVSRGLALARRGWSIYRATGSEVGGAHFRTQLARILASAGQPSQALALLGEASGHTEFVITACEILLLRGQLLATGASEEPPTHDSEASAEAYFRGALEHARSLGAKSLELRSALALARLLVARGELEDVSRLVGDILRWFGEGHETPDLIEARQLCDRLRRDRSDNGKSGPSAPPGSHG